jgi:hypothetical protein
LRAPSPEIVEPAIVCAKAGAAIRDATKKSERAHLCDMFVVPRNYLDGAAGAAGIAKVSGVTGTLAFAAAMVITCFSEGGASLGPLVIENGK